MADVKKIATRESYGNTLKELAARVADALDMQGGGVNPVALMAAVGAGGSLSGISPLSTGGALAMAALATALPNRTKEDENKTFVQLFIYAGLAIVILIVLCSTIYVPLANLLHG